MLLATSTAPQWDWRPSIGLALTIEGPIKRVVFWVPWKYDVWLPVDSPLLTNFKPGICTYCGEPLPHDEPSSC